MTDNSFEKTIFSLTTLILVDFKVDGNKCRAQGTGFYYNEVSPVDATKKGPQWHRLEKHWLVTNRHVIFPKKDGIEYIPDRLVFCLREIEGDEIKWKPITLTRDDVLRLTRVHKADEIDVAILDITEYIKNVIQTMSQTKKNNVMIPSTLSNLNLPENQPLTIDVTSEIVVASYPKGFYDEVNKFPIIKSGIVASAWGFNFKGLPMFQIDAQLFPGSSGGLVISKPNQIAVIDGKLSYSEDKQFVLLGIYSGEFRWYDSLKIGDEEIKISNSYGLGNVWYAQLIPEIIKNGISYPLP